MNPVRSGLPVFRCHALFTLLLIELALCSSAQAYDQWSFNAAVDAGTKFDTEAEAAAHMRSYGGKRALLTIRGATVDMAMHYATTAWQAPDEEPFYADDWTYQWAGVSGTYTSEEDMVAAIIAELETYQCPLNHFELLPPYVTASSFLPDLPTRQEMYFEYRYDIPWYDPNLQQYVCLENTNAPNGSHFRRDRTATCPTYYTANAQEQICKLNYVDYTQRNSFTRSCPNEGMPCDNNAVYEDCSKDGNPCNAATGNKLIQEIDYSGPGVEVVREYNSLMGNLGWSHNFSASLLVSGSTPLGLVTHQGYDEPFKNYGPNQYIAYTGSGIEARLESSEWVIYYPSGTKEYFPSAGGELLRREDPAGRVTTVTHTTDTTVITGPFGHTLTFQLDPDNLGRPDSLTLPDGQQILYEYNAGGHLWKVTYPDETAREYHYEDLNSDRLVTGITDENGDRFSTYSYDVVGRVITSAHAGGYGKVTLSYGTDSTIVTDAVGTIKTYNFTTASGRPRKITSVLLDGTTRSYTYPGWTSDNQQRPTQVNDENGVNTRFTYDSHHNTSKTLAYGTPQARTINYFYLDDVTDRLTKLQTPSVYGGSFREVETTFNLENLPATIEILGFTPSGTAISRSTNFQYNSFGQVTQIDGPRPDVSDITTMTYNECTTGAGCGQLASITSAVGHITTFDSYDSNARLLQMTDPNNLVTTYTYDLRGRVTSVTETPPSGPARIASFTYDNAGQLTTVTAPNGTILTYAYDAAHNLTSITDNLGNTVEYGYDLNGNRTDEDIKDPFSVLTKTVDYTYDARNRIDTINSAGSITDLVFDALGNLTDEADPNLNSTDHGYDPLNRLSQTLDALSGVTAYGYDKNDYLTSVEAPNGATTTYAYDDLGNLLSATSPDTGTTTYTYDAVGNRLTQTDANSVTVTYTYDALNRLTSSSYPDTSLNVSLTYDELTNQKGHLTTMADASGTTTFSYDVFGNLVQESKLIDGSTHVTAYAYDAADLLSQIAYPSGRTVDYTRNVLGQVAQVDTTYDLTNQTVASSIAYEPFGPLSGLTFGNNLAMSRAYDQQYRLTDQATGAVQDLDFTVDAAGNIDAITDWMNTSLNQSFTQDALHRVDYEAGSYGTKSYTSDAVGNRLSRVHDDGSITTQALTYVTNANRLATHDGNTVTIDSAGNTTADPTLSISFAYGDHNRMEEAYVGAILQASYVYNGQGQRVKKVEATGAQRTFVFHYGLNGELLGETVYDNLGAKIQERDYIWLDTLPLAQSERNFSGMTITSSSFAYIHADQLNTPRVASDSSQTVVWRWDSDAFGVGDADTDPDLDTNLVNIRLRFPGQYYDQESGLHYNYFRYYDPNTGRYITSDPLGLVPSLNTYAYVDSNPLSFIDPTGLAKCVYSISRHTVVCTTDDGSQSAQTGPDGVFSGQQECKDNPDCADEKSKGPTPPGIYEMIPSEKYGGSWWLKEGFFTRQFCKLGIGRCEFFFHEGTISEGCITVDRTNENARKKFNEIKKILRIDPTNTMTVVP